MLKSNANRDYLADLIRFIDASPTPFHAVANAAARLTAAGYTQLREGDAWNKVTGKVFVTRNDSSLVAVNLQRAPAEHGFRIVGAHTDSPCLKLKPNAIVCNDGYAKLGVEVYGGALLAPWFDRDLGLAGRVTLIADGRQQNRLINFARPVATIPSLAIHLDRNVNNERRINKQHELPAVLCRLDDDAPDWHAVLRARLQRQYPDLQVREVLAFELSLYDCQGGAVVGLHDEFIACARLDNLLSCYAGLQALLAAAGDANRALVMNDHEEVGSVSAAGADGDFLRTVLLRLCGDEIGLARALSHSMLVSADNAHAVHPNYPHKHDALHRPLLNAGPVVKVNANQNYASNSESEGLFRRICAQVGVPLQTIAVRSDMACGSTIGPITAAKLGVRTLDIGAPQLAMHSIRELAGAEDQAMLRDALVGFYDAEEWPFSCV